MLIARELRKTNIAEYILYMWQVEDMLRSCSFDEVVIEKQLVSRFQPDGSTNPEIKAWYLNLARMMEKEHILVAGHLQVLKNLVNDLNEFHLKLIQTQADLEYVRLYHMNLSAIIEFREKSAKTENEVEACLNALYIALILKLKKAEISEQTHETVLGFGKLMGHLVSRYVQFENDEFEF